MFMQTIRVTFNDEFICNALQFGRLVSIRPKAIIFKGSRYNLCYKSVYVADVTLPHQKCTFGQIHGHVYYR